MEKSKAIRRAEAALILLFLLALILPQVIGSEETAEILHYTAPVITDDVYAVILKSRYAGAERETAAEDAVPATKAEKFWNGLLNSLDKNFVREDRWKSLLSGLGVTVSLSALSILLGTVLGGFICFMRMSPNPLPSAFARIYIRWLQGMPIVLMLLILFALGADEETIMADFLLTNEYNAALIAEEREYLIENGVTEEELEAFMKVMDQVFPNSWKTPSSG